MSLMKQIVTDQVNARKEKNTIKTSILTTLIGEASMIGKNDGNRETTDLELINVIKKFIKNIDETLKVKNDSKLEDEKVILSGYLPVQLTDEELTEIIEGIVGMLDCDNQNKMFGLVMKNLKEKYEGSYDGKVASTIIRNVLS